MNKQKLFIANILMAIVSYRREESFSVVTWPLTERLNGECCVRFVLTWYNHRFERYERLLDMPMSGLELHWVVDCFRYYQKNELAAKVETRFNMHYEMEYTRVVPKMSVKEWQSL